MTRHQFFSWFYGGALVATFLMFQVALSQRDEARNIKAQLGADSLVCKVVPRG